MEYILIFLEGIASFISPCVLPLVPIYISYFAGQNPKKNKAITNSIAFVIGYSIVFSILAILANRFGMVLVELTKAIKIILGSVIILLGLNYMDVLKIKIFDNFESNTFDPIYLHFTNPFGPEYYNNYELKFIISKDDYEKNNLSFGAGEDLETLTYGLQRESKDEDTYVCTAKVTKDFHEEMFYGFKKVYNEMRGIKSEDTISYNTIQENTNSNTTQNNQTTEEIVNAPSINEDWWKEYDLAIDNLDTKYFVTDFETYKSSDKSKNLTNKQISEIAEKGFEESAKRIAEEGASNKETEKIVLEEVIPNNSFTRKYRESDTNYQELKMNAYVVTRENEMGCGIKIYIDPTTALIVGGDAYGD